MRLKGRAWLLCLLIPFLGAALLSPPPVLAATLPLYTLDVSVEYDSGLVKARETLALTNRSSQTWDSLVFNVTPANYDAFRLLGATVNALEVQTRLEGSILELSLLQPLPPGAAVVATLEFELQVPWRGGRFGRGTQVMALGNWFPILAVYRDGRLLAEGQPGGWVRGQYIEIGDAFFSQTSDFVVILSTDRPLTVAHTGNLLSQEETTWRFQARGVRDFALALSPDFATASRQVQGVEIIVFYLPGHQAAAESYLRAASDMLGWMEENLVPYPYSGLSLAEINSPGSTTVGQEYPNLIFMADNIASSAGGVDSYGSVLASHEVAHQWYYGIVGNDQLYEPWLDEALVTWLSYHLVRTQSMFSFSRIWQNRVLSPLLPGLPVNIGIYDYLNEGPYLALAYRRGALFLEDLYQLMGEEDFLAALKQYTVVFSGHIATPYAFLDTMQAYSQANLNPLLSRYLSYPRYLAAEPLRVSVRYPQGEWSGTVQVDLEAEDTLQEVQVFVDDRLYLQAQSSPVLVEANTLVEGPHLLTVRAGNGQREVDVVGTFLVKQPPPPPPTPAPASMAKPEAPEETLQFPLEMAASDSRPTAERRAAGLALVTLSAVALALGLARRN